MSIIDRESFWSACVDPKRPFSPGTLLSGLPFGIYGISLGNVVVGTGYIILAAFLMTLSARASGPLRKSIRPLYMIFFPSLAGFGISGAILIVRGASFFPGAEFLPVIGMVVGLIIGLSWLMIEYIAWIIWRKEPST